jgi:hypothetical protein
LNKAVRAPPICRNPVGEGANLVTTGGDIYVSIRNDGLVMRAV